MTEVLSPDTCVLTDRVFRILTETGFKRVNLPELLSEMSGDTVVDIPGLRAHQHHAAHMFLAQLTALTGLVGRRYTACEYQEALLHLSGDDPQAWKVFPQLGQVGFLQPALDPEAKAGKRGHSPSSIDILFLAKNHSIKREAQTDTELDSWLWYLVTVQTCAAYETGKFTVFRISCGVASRSFWAVYDQSWKLGRRIHEDARMINERVDDTCVSFGFAKNDGIKLMWLAPWLDDAPLSVADVDGRVIEVARRINLALDNKGRVCAEIRTSPTPRTTMGTSKTEEWLKGVCGDIWAPVQEVNESVSAFSVQPSGICYKTLSAFGLGKATDTFKAMPSPASTRIVDNPVLVAVGIAVDRGKTLGLYRREITLGASGKNRGPFAIPTLSGTAEAMVRDAQKLELIMKDVTRAYMGLQKPKTPMEPDPLPEWARLRSEVAVEKRLDEVFFDYLPLVHSQRREDLVDWVRQLYYIGRAVLHRVVSEIPVRNLKTMQRVTEARMAFENMFWSDRGSVSFAPYRDDVLCRNEVAFG